MINCTQSFEEECKGVACCTDDPGGSQDYVASTLVKCTPVPIVGIIPESGTTQSFPVEVTLVASRSDALIYYTTDGSTPTTGSTPYTAPFELNDPSLVVQAIAVVTGCDPGPVSVAQYLAPEIPLPDIWLKADAVTGKVNDDPVDDWIDSTGNGHDGIYLAGGIPVQNHVIYKTGVQNGLPAMYFGDHVGMCTNWSRTAGSAFTLFAVVRLNDMTVANRRLINNGCFGGNNFLIGPYSGTWQLFNSNFITGPAINANNHILSATQKTGETNFYLDGILVGTNVPVNWFGEMGIGNTGVDEDFLGYVFEIIGWERILTAPEQAATLNALQLKWAI